MKANFADIETRVLGANASSAGFMFLLPEQRHEIGSIAASLKTYLQQRAYQADRGAFASYSGKPKAVKQALEERRQQAFMTAVDHLLRRHCNMAKLLERLGRDWIKFHNVRRKFSDIDYLVKTLGVMRGYGAGVDSINRKLNEWVHPNMSWTGGQPRLVRDKTFWDASKAQETEVRLRATVSAYKHHGKYGTRVFLEDEDWREPYWGED